MPIIAITYFLTGLVILLWSERRAEQEKRDGPFLWLFDFSGIGMLLFIGLWPLWLILDQLNRHTLARFSQWEATVKATQEQSEGNPQTVFDPSWLKKTGKTLSALRPQGMILIEGHRIVAQSQSGLIQPNQEVKVVAIRNGKVVVESIG
ncbi:MAG: NfeD family protein [Verrucomicrobiota bacterium]|nr:NfeD family protein [Verrucomicrobiota bacterium]